MSSHEHYNLYGELENLDTIAVPSILLTMVRGNLASTSIVVLLYLVKAAAEYGSSIVRVHTEQIRKDTKLSRETVTKARKELEAFNLVASKETDSKGVWEYELLDPATGAAIPNRSSVDYAKVSDWVAMEFYRHLLPDRWDSKYEKFWCPFANHSHPSFRVHTARGTKKHGTWSCNQCGRDSKGKRRGDYGGFIDLYERMHNVERNIATWRVQVIMQSLMSQEKRAYNREWEEKLVLEEFYGK
jgi:hypothetical protein